MDDLHKMHSYRDAVTAARSAWVLYPGDVTELFLDEGADALNPVGVGAFPARPGRSAAELGAHLDALLDHRSPSTS